MAELKAAGYAFAPYYRGGSVNAGGFISEWQQGQDRLLSNTSLAHSTESLDPKKWRNSTLAEFKEMNQKKYSAEAGGPLSQGGANGSTFAIQPVQVSLPNPGVGNVDTMLYIYAGNNPVGAFDYLGLEVRVMDTIKATIGIVSNAAGVATGVGMAGAPTGVAQVLGAVFIAKSAYGVAANSANLSNAIQGKDPVSTGGAITDAAAAVAPENQTVQNVAAATDLAVDLACGQVGKASANQPVSMSAGYTLTETGAKVPLLDSQMVDPTNLGAVAEVFQGAAAVVAGVDAGQQIKDAVVDAPPPLNLDKLNGNAH